MFLFFRLFAGGFFFVLTLRLALVGMALLELNAQRNRRVVAIISNENCEQGLGQTLAEERSLDHTSSVPIVDARNEIALVLCRVTQLFLSNNNLNSSSERMNGR